MSQPMLYADLVDVRAALRIDPADTQYDAVLSVAISAASRKVDEYCNRYFGQIGTMDDPDQRLYRANAQRILIDDLVSLVRLEFDYTGFLTTFTEFDASSVIPSPVNAANLQPARPYTMLLAKPNTTLPQPPGWVRVSGVFGWPVVPDPVRQATLLQAIRVFKAQDVPLGLVASSDAVSVMRLPRGLHPDAAELLSGFERDKGGGFA